MSDDSDQEYVYSEDEDDYNDDEDAEMSDADAPAAPRARKSGSTGSKDDGAPSRLGDGAYALMEPADVERMMVAKAREVSETLDARPGAPRTPSPSRFERRPFPQVPPESAEVLLRHVGWSAERLMEAFWSDGERLTGAAGVDTWAADGGEAAAAAVALPSAEGTVTCRICFDDVPASSGRSAPCGHFFCEDCYGGYLANAVDEGASCVMATCPEQGCATRVPGALFADLVDAKRADRRRSFRLENFVSFSKDLRWCPGKGCGRVARAGAGVGSVKCAPNGCGCNFCMRCGEEAHSPASCGLIAQWTEKCQNESETANWILANTKRCPKCQTRIEKNQGCNHINCSQCKYEFCWMCMGDWADHGATTGGFYKCNKYDPLKAEADDGAMDDQARAKRELDRYLHYYKRFHGHDQSQAFATKQLESTEKRMVELQESTHGSWIDVQFLKTANEMVIDCRRVLKNTYVFGYYLPTPAKRQRELFENLQEHLERFTETLSEMTELPLDQMDRSEIVNVTRVTESFLANLIQGAEAGLDVPDDDAAPAAAAA